MSLNLRQNKHFLELLTKSQPLQQRALLVTASPSQIRAICECIINVLHATVPMNDQEKTSLRPHLETFYKLADNGYPYASKKKLMVQTGGGFLDQVLPILLPVLSFML